MHFSDDKHPVQTCKLVEGSGNSPGDEELRYAILPRIMIDRDFGKDVPCILNLFYKLKADRATDALQFDLFQNLFWNQTKITIHVTDADAEKEFYKVVIRPPDHDPHPRVIAG